MKKVAVVTGAFGGIGYDILKAFDEADYAIVALSRTAESDQNKLKLSAIGGYFKLGINCDVTDTEQVERAVNIITAEFGKINVLVNCAGFSQGIAHNNFTALTDQIFDSIIQTNLRGVWTMTRTVIPHLADDSVIVNISSAAGIRWGGSNIAYASAKAGVDSMTRNLARALAPKTRVVSIAPGAVDTGFAPGANYQQAIATTPLGRIAQPSDISHMVMSVVNNKFITGNTIVVDGGRGI